MSMPVEASPLTTDLPVIHAQRMPLGSFILRLSGNWTTLGLASSFGSLREEIKRHSGDARLGWDLSAIERIDHTGALFLWRTWGQSFPTHLVISEAVREYFAVLSPFRGSGSPSVAATRLVRRGIERLGVGARNLLAQLFAIVSLIGLLLLDAVSLTRNPRRWPAREISAAVYRAGAQALGILGLVGFLIGVVLSYVAGEQLHRFGMEIYVVNLLGIGCVRELGPLLAAILVAGRSGSAMTAQLGVMRLNEELDALTTLGVRYTQRLILPKVLALALSQPLAGLWTSAFALLGGMLAAHSALGIDYSYFLESLCRVVPISNYWLGLGKSAVFGVTIALIACNFGLRIRPNTESLGAGTTAAVVIAISSVLVADAMFAVLFAHVGTGI